MFYDVFIHNKIGELITTSPADNEALTHFSIGNSE